MNHDCQSCQRLEFKPNIFPQFLGWWCNDWNFKQEICLCIFGFLPATDHAWRSVTDLRRVKWYNMLQAFFRWQHLPWDCSRAFLTVLRLFIWFKSDKLWALVCRFQSGYEPPNIQQPSFLVDKFWKATKFLSWQVLESGARLQWPKSQTTKLHFLVFPFWFWKRSAFDENKVFRWIQGSFLPPRKGSSGNLLLALRDLGTTFLAKSKSQQKPTKNHRIKRITSHTNKTRHGFGSCHLCGSRCLSWADVGGASTRGSRESCWDEWVEIPTSPAGIAWFLCFFDGFSMVSMGFPWFSMGFQLQKQNTLKTYGFWKAPQTRPESA